MKKGQKVLCPGCKNHLFTINRDVYTNDAVSTSFLDPANQAPRSDERAISICCGDDFTRNTTAGGVQFCTDQGWIGGE